MIRQAEKGSLEPSLLLDSKLISPTFFKKYDIKIVDCGDYVQVYYYQNLMTKKQEKDDFDLQLKRTKIDSALKTENNKHNNSSELKQIEVRNIIRSKLQCQRLAKANSRKWRIFLTLTIAENLGDLKEANKKFRYFVDKVRRIKKDFSYIAIPEFQKRGAVHYHLLCNIDINDENLIYSQEDNPKFKHVKYWHEGFTEIEVVRGDVKKIVGYISKYMTKEIDNRLFSHHRYFYSKNLKLPKESYIDTTNEKEEEFYKKIIQDKDLIYQSEYINSYNGTSVVFLEFNKSNTIIQ